MLWPLYLQALSDAAAAGDIVAANHLDVALGSLESRLGSMRIELEKRRQNPGYAAECAAHLQERPSRFQRYSASESSAVDLKFDGTQRTLF
jgi:hypothetical protein